MKRNKGSVVIMRPSETEQYPAELQGVNLVITHVATKYMPAPEFFAKGRPEGYRPGYDTGISPEPLYDLKRQDTGEDLGFSLYDWEVKTP